MEIDWDYARNADLWEHEEACRYVCPKDAAARAKLDRLVRVAIDAGTLWPKRFFHQRFHPGIDGVGGAVRREIAKICVKPAEFLAFAQSKGFTIPADLAGIESQRPAGWPWGEYETELLRKLASAARKFWLPYEQSKHSKAPIKPPINKAVAGWLTEHGVSPRIAAVMATILRDDNQSRGRPKKRP